MKIFNIKCTYSALVILFCILFIFQPGERINAQSREAQVKAAYIEKFARFTTWPVNNVSETFNITIIGKDFLEGSLSDIFRQYKIKNLPVNINYINDIEELNGCNILVISDSKRNEIANILTRVKGKPILTIGSAKNFGARGVHFNFYLTEKGTIHFEINQSKIKESGLSIDMYLLEVGKKVGG